MIIKISKYSFIVSKNIRKIYFFLIRILTSPKTATLVSFYMLILWLILGAFDTFYFKIDETSTNNVFGPTFNRYIDTKINQKEVLSWIEDGVGHWLILFCVVASIVMRFALHKLDVIASHFRIRHKRFLIKYFKFALLSLLILFSIYVIVNIEVVKSEKNVIMWTTLINKGLPIFLAINYYIIVIVPLTLVIFSYIGYLNIIANNITNLEIFNPIHGDKKFGLTRVGFAMTWTMVALVIMNLVELVIQTSTKNGELTLNNFITAVLFLVMLWFIFLRPLYEIYTKLDYKKAELNTRVVGEIGNVVDQIKNLETQMDSININEYEMLNSKLDQLKSDRDFYASLSVNPLRKVEMLSGGIATIGTIVALIVNLLNLINLK